MSVDEVMVRVESDTLLEENYTLLPYIKVEDDNMMILNSESYKEDTSAEAVLCVPIADTLFDCNIDGSFIEQQTECEDFLNEHNYNTSDENNTMNMYWADTPKKENVNLKCTFCQKIMKTPGGFYRHLRTHTGEKPFQCQLCDKKFSQQSNLWKHVLIHTGERRFECPHCNKKFSQRANMQKHMMVHTGEKPFHCAVCDRTFTQRANLNKHIRIHTGEKPYSCKYCSRQFAQQSNMQKHEMIHEGLKPFTCTMCTSAFTQQSNLKKHMEIHTTSPKPRSPKSDTMYSCNACLKGYKSLDGVYKHMVACPHIENANIVIEMDENEDSDNVGEIYIDVTSTEETNKELPIMRNSQELWLQNVIVSNDMFINEHNRNCT